MKGIIKRYFNLILPVFTGGVFLLFPSKAFALLLGFSSSNPLFKGAIDFIGDLIKPVIDWFIELIFGKCPDAQDYLNRNLGENSCWICKLFDKIFDAINLLATSVYNKTHMSFISLLAVCLGLYIVLRIGKAFLSLQPQDPMDFWNQMGKVLFKTIVASALLVQPAGVLGYWLVSPFIELSVSFNQVILESLVEGAAYNELSESERKNAEKWVQEQLEKINQSDGAAADSTEYLDYLSAWRGTSNLSYSSLTQCTAVQMTEAEAAKDGKLFNSQIRNALECMVKGLYKEAAFALSVSSYMICHGFRYGTIPLIDTHWGMLFAGIAMWATCFIIIIMFAFKIIDATVRLGILCALLPMFVVAWVFPPTVSYTKKAVQILIQVMLMYIVTAIIMALAIVIIMNAFSVDTIDFDLRQAFNNNKTKEIGDNIGVSAGAFFIGLFCCVLAVLVMKIIDKVASEYGGVDFGNNTADSVGAMATKVTMLTTQAAVRSAKLAAAKFGLPSAGDVAGRVVEGAAQSAISAGRSAGSKLNSRLSAKKEAYKNKQEQDKMLSRLDNIGKAGKKGASGEDVMKSYKSLAADMKSKAESDYKNGRMSADDYAEVQKFSNTILHAKDEQGLKEVFGKTIEKDLQKGGHSTDKFSDTQKTLHKAMNKIIHNIDVREKSGKK
jgi:type IV secretory pathway VirB6-like protein